MVKGARRKFEVRFGAAQTTALIGLCLGSMAAAYYMGFQSGRSTGYETAFQSSIAASAKIPIAADMANGGDADLLSLNDVYKKLDAEDNVKEESENTTAVKPILEVDAERDKGLIEVLNKEKEPTPEDDVWSNELAKIDADSKKVKDSAENKLAIVIDPLSADKNTQQANSGDSTLSKPASSEEKTAVEARFDEPKKLGVPDKLMEKKTSEATGAIAVAKAPEAKTLSEVAKNIQVVAPPKQDDRSTLLPKNTGVSSGWYAQVAAPRLEADATSLSNKLKGSGFRVVIENAEVRGEKYFRVLVGPEVSRTHAERLIGQLRRESYLDDSAFIKFVR